jgi:hypothetical protein
VRLSPVIDRITTSIYERLEATGSLSWQPVREWSLGARASGGVVVSGQQLGDKVATGEIFARWSPTKTWELDAGMRGLSQVASASAPSYREVMFYLGGSAQDRQRL